MKRYVIFDDTNKKSEVIRDIIGDKGFADVVVKKKHLSTYYYETVARLYPDAQWRIIRSVFDFLELEKELESFPDETIKVLHCFSNFIISDAKQALLSFEKLNYIDDDYKVISNRKIAAAMFCSGESYLRFLHGTVSGRSSLDVIKGIEFGFEIEGVTNIGFVHNFTQCITGNFDSRYFNSLQGNDYTLVKSSGNKKKIKSEYLYYHLLPEDMKYWYVMPFHYEETADAASYTMERLHMTDLAVKWVHGAIDEAEFEEILNRYFYFFRCRHEKAVSADAYQQIADKLYVDKVNQRVAALKEMPEYEKINGILETGGTAFRLDTLLNQYFTLKKKTEENVVQKPISVIGHGDPCFANTLYNKSTKTLKFIDPKGALTEAELWTNPYYDIAKLSHSVCGLYDFFNNAMFDIRINENFACDLNIHFDNAKYIEIFKQKLEENGYDYALVRLYEASLFLSMLPLHIDYPHKVLGFILNAKRILEEVAQYVS